MRVQQNDEYISMLELCTANNEKLRHSLLRNNNRWIFAVFSQIRNLADWLTFVEQNTQKLKLLDPLQNYRLNISQ